MLNERLISDALDPQQNVLTIVDADDDANSPTQPAAPRMKGQL